LNSLFFNCSSLISLPDISKWNIFNSKVNNDYLSFLSDLIFYDENERQYIFETLSKILENKYENDIYLKDLDYKCFYRKSYKIEELAKFFKNRFTINGLFAGCSSLKELPNISKWDIQNVKDIGSMFTGCTSLITLPDISIWNTKNIINMNGLFLNCSSLKSLPDISKWNINNVNDISFMFNSCLSLESLPDISHWNIANVNNISGLFYDCSSLKYLPDISKWNTNNINYMDGLFGNVHY